MACLEPAGHVKVRLGAKGFGGGDDDAIARDIPSRLPQSEAKPSRMPANVTSTTIEACIIIRPAQGPPI